MFLRFIIFTGAVMHDMNIFTISFLPCPPYYFIRRAMLWLRLLVTSLWPWRPRFREDVWCKCDAGTGSSVSTLVVSCHRQFTDAPHSVIHHWHYSVVLEIDIFSSYFPFKSATLSPAFIFFTKHLIGTFSDIVALKFLHVTSFSVPGFFFF